MAKERSSSLGANAIPAADVVIVSYRSRELVRACLSSLRDHEPQAGMRVFVVDNASSDGTVEMIRSDFPNVEVIASERNLGFGAGNNLAIRRGSSRYVLALNPDARLASNVLDPLIRLLDERREVGVCGCRLVKEDDSFDHASKRSFPTVAGALGHFLGSAAPHALRGRSRSIEPPMSRPDRLTP